MNINDVVVYLDTKGVEHNGLVKDVNQLHDGYLSLSYQDSEGRSIDVYDVPHFAHPSREETNPDLPTFHLHCWKNRGEDHTPIPKDHPMFDHPFEPITKDDDGRRIPKPRPLYDAVIAEHMASKLPPADEPTPVQSEVPDYKELREQLNDATSVFYGPHPCGTCGYTVIRRALGQGGESFEERDPNLGPPRYQLHVCPATTGNVTIIDAPRPE